MNTEQMTKIAIAALEDIKGRDITVLDTRKLTSLFDAMIICTGESTRQIKALADHAFDKLKAAGVEILGTEGEQASEWVLVDAGDIVIHVMHPSVRQLYNLEELWGAAEKSAATHPRKTHA